ncbi:MAG: glycosyltransferase [Lentisphaerae bacterium]|nr:glycosyltransferase [Lentisphaerota bacterium]
MNVVFVNHQDFLSNSAVHIFHIANELATRGTPCTVVVPAHKQTVHRLGTPRFDVLTFREALQNRARFPSDSLIYAWTPREIVRQQTCALATLLRVPYMVHMEDNEAAILEAQTGLSAGELTALSPDALDRAVGPHCAHPVRSQEFLSGAAGVSVIIQSLKEQVPPPVPTVTLWPGYDTERFKPAPRNDRLRARYGAKDSDFLVVYTGGTHRANAAEVTSLYAAVALARQRGIPARLVRTGQQANRLRNRVLGRTPHYCKELGYVARDRLPAILAMADAVIQPGAPGPFNDYRFPSKLPEFFAMQRPVVLPFSNIGRFMEDEKHCLLLRNGGAEEIADKIEQLYRDRPLADRLAVNGRIFAEEHFQWPHTVDRLLQFWNSHRAAFPMTGTEYP